METILSLTCGLYFGILYILSLNFLANCVYDSLMGNDQWYVCIGNHHQIIGSMLDMMLLSIVNWLVRKLSSD